MTIPIGLQIYSVREDTAKDFKGVMTKIASIGYAGVEPTFSIPGTTLPEAIELIKELQFEVPSAHVPLPLGENRNKVLDYLAAFACKRFFPSTPRDSFESVDEIRQVCDRFNEAQAIAAENGVTLGVHTHWWEFQQVDGQCGYHVMLEHLDPAILFQLDTYWIKTAGLDPAEVVKEFGARAPLLHIKDGPAVKDEPMVAVGDGVIDVPSIVSAAEGTAEWLIVELDRCATDMLEAVEKSYRYLVEAGLGYGR
jgi:sugar phosphate isomerase/epimerase